MVGKKPGLIPLREVSRAASRIVNAPYLLGSVNPELGLDCISSIYVFYKDLGIEIPERFEGLSIRNYAAFWQKDPGAAKIKMMRYLLSLGEEIDAKFRQPGDLLFLEHEGQTMVGVFLGNGNVLASDLRVGTRIFPLKSLKGEVKRVQRLCRRP